MFIQGNQNLQTGKSTLSDRNIFGIRKMFANSIDVHVSYHVRLDDAVSASNKLAPDESH